MYIHKVQQKTLAPNGYNIAVGGKAPMKNRKHSESAKEKIRNYQKGKKKSIFTKEHRKKLSLNNGMRGKTGAKHHNSKTIFCVELNKSFGSTYEAARRLSLAPQNINKVLKNKRKTCGGYSFRYIGESNG